jgi:hypothetical protein
MNGEAQTLLTESRVFDQGEEKRGVENGFFLCYHPAKRKRLLSSKGIAQNCILFIGK